MAAYILEVVPHLRVQVASAVLVLLMDGVFLFQAWRALERSERSSTSAQAGDWTAASARLPTTRWSEWALIFGWLLIPMLGLASLHGAIRRFLQAQTLSDPAAKVDGFRLCIEGYLNAIPCTILLTVPILLVAVLGWAIAVAARLRGQWLGTLVPMAKVDSETARAGLAIQPPTVLELVAIPAAFLLLGLAPLVRAVWRFSLDMIHSLSMLAGVDPEMKAIMLAKLLEEHEEPLVTWFTASIAGTVVALALSLYVLRQWRRRAARFSELPTLVPNKRRSLTMAGALATAAATAFLFVLPLRAENRALWPPSRELVLPLLAYDASASVVDGPDRLERAAVVQITRAGASINGRPTDGQKFASELEVMQHNWQLLHPSELPQEIWLLTSSSDVPIAQVQPFLSVARDLGFVQPIFTFPRRHMVARPFLGSVAEMGGTGARATIAKANAVPSSGATQVSVLGYATWGELAREVVKLRRRGQQVVLVL